jgi:hypothetical protein
MCLHSVFVRVVVCFVCSSGGVGSKNGRRAAGYCQVRRKFLEICSDIDNQPNEGFVDGFNVHDELLGVPERDRMVCMPRAVITVQIVRVIRNTSVTIRIKTRRATRYVASLALVRAFPCKAGK